MVRRNKPKITGEDPKYSHTFERLRPVPSDMPPDVKIPGVETVEDKPSTETKPGPIKAESQATKPDKKPTAARAKKPPKSVKTPKPQQKKVDPPKGDRQVTLDAAVKVQQADAMKPLLEKGLQQRDIIMLAGRRTTEQFVLSPKYLPKPEADRLPMSEGYHTSKRLDAAILEAMRDEHDPLRVRSDPAMVRGQFETLFWQVLDDVIAELIEKYC